MLRGSQGLCDCERGVNRLPAGDGTPSGPHGLELRSDTDTGSPDVAWELRKSVRALELMLEASAGAV